MAVTGGAPLIRGNTVTQNTARDSTCTAGGGAGILLVGSDAQVIGNTITDNTWAQGGGGLSVSGGAPLILDNVISGNSGPQGWSGGGGDFIVCLGRSFAWAAEERFGGRICVGFGLRVHEKPGQAD